MEDKKPNRIWNWVKEHEGIVWTGIGCGVGLVAFKVVSKSLSTKQMNEFHAMLMDALDKGSEVTFRSDGSMSILKPNKG